ncbi:hypothetical protein COB52_01780 [Candidatus Kaiserbacteria bacterium]|nr:MAG: hypothetical protein COB52_01780 [Candidatus Kaiserbacteria bacterium]
MKYNIRTLLIAVLLVILVFLLVNNNRSQDILLLEEDRIEIEGAEYSISLTKEGYDPSEITILAGDRITFSADPEYYKFHWPASNIHPTHSIYSEFDPRDPIKSVDKWSFIFDDRGAWRFHDHLAPYYTGVIIVK